MFLDDVVVIGYGSQKKKEVTGSVASVKAEDFNAGVKTSPVGLLQGKVAGLNIIRTTSDPTSTGFNVQIRGFSTLDKGAGTSPLYIVDGVPVSNIDNISPDEIASMDVLKDGSAAAIYGTRGTNGVILITTKRGEGYNDQAETQLEYSGYMNVSWINSRVGMANADEFRKLSEYTGGLLSGIDHGANTDWTKAMSRDAAITHNHNVAITGFGVIDGNGEHFIEDMRHDCYHGYYGWRNGLLKCRYPEIQRPGQLICFIECENVTLENITVQNLTCWGCFFHGCENVQIRGIKVRSPITTCNSDGIDIDCCRYVTVSDCIIRTGDDAIAIRCDSERLKHPKPCEYITVANCVLSSSSSVVRIGVGSGIIRHVRFSNIVIERGGTAFNFMTSYAHNGEAFIEDVNFSNVSAACVSFPWKLKGSEGAIKDITIENYRANAIAFSEITALDNCKIENVRLSNIFTHFVYIK